MLHGWPQHWYMWRGLVPLLSDRYRLICPDLRGFGWSDAPAGAYEKETLASDMLALMDALGLERVKLVGHDWGGYVGFLMALFHPERFERYLPFCITHPWVDFNPRRLKTIWRSAYQWVLASPAGPALLRTQPAVVGKVLQVGTHDASVWTQQEIAVFSNVLKESDRARATQQLYRTFLLREVVPLVRGRYRSQRLTVPTRLVLARHDPAIGRSMTRGFEPYADAMEVKVVENAGHFIADEKPDIVAEEMLDFFG